MRNPAGRALRRQCGHPAVRVRCDMPPKRQASPARTSDWLSKTHARTRDPGSVGAAPKLRGEKRWTEAAEVFDSDQKRGRMPNLPGVSSSGSAASRNSGPSPVPANAGTELMKMMSTYARSVLSMKPAGFDPFGYTKIIRGRPVQVLALCASKLCGRGACRCACFWGGRAGTRTWDVWSCPIDRALCRFCSPASRGKHALPWGVFFRNQARLL